MVPRALITGITGMVGSHLADFLLEQTDWDIFGLYRWRSPLDNLEQQLERINRRDRLYLLYGDLLDELSLQKVVAESRPNFVFHLAAQSYPQTSFSSSVNTLDVNILGTERLLEVLRVTPGLDPVIHVCSSSEVFGRVAQDKLPINEECSFHPASPYSISKIGTDFVGRFHAEAYGQKCLITRMFTHTGPRRGDVFVESTFAKQISLIEAGLIPPVVKTGNLDSLRTWADVRDAVRAYHLLVTINPQSGECYNIGGDYSCSVRDMLKFLISLSSCKDDISVETEPDRLRPLDADLQVPDTTKFRKHTGWQPEITFERTMADLLDYWRAKVAKNSAALVR